MRSEASRIAILEATLRLLEVMPLQHVSIDAIAREAGVGKATIYRWWPSKASVVIDAFIRHHGVNVPILKNVGPSEALARHIHLLVKEYGSWAGSIVAQLMAEGQNDPAVMREFRDRFWEVRRAMVRQLIDEARQVGEFRTDVDVAVQEYLIYAPIYMALMFQHPRLDRAFADSHCAAVMKALRPAPTPPQRRPLR
ncbi:TetR/AcrR family transcriptional regulator [Aquabacterium sp.]|uniref:TetR/AcrR family transcriptional regulator n=1 Tax=Aquabacterium sp. TaxID=1872578 RepID=UPI003BB1E53B